MSVVCVCVWLVLLVAGADAVAGDVIGDDVAVDDDAVWPASEFVEFAIDVEFDPFWILPD